MHALRRVHRSLGSSGVLLDLQPSLANAPVRSSGVLLGRIDETEFREVADRINAALEETVAGGLFVLDTEITLDVVHRFHATDELLREVATWTGTKIPPALVARIERREPPVDVHEGAKLRRFLAR